MLAGAVRGTRGREGLEEEMRRDKGKGGAGGGDEEGQGEGRGWRRR